MTYVVSLCSHKYYVLCDVLKICLVIYVVFYITCSVVYIVFYLAINFFYQDILIFRKLLFLGSKIKVCSWRQYQILKSLAKHMAILF